MNIKFILEWLRENLVFLSLIYLVYFAVIIYMLASMPTVTYRDVWGYPAYIITRRLYEGDLAHLSYVQNLNLYGKVLSTWWQLIPPAITVAFAKLTGSPLNTVYTYGFWSTMPLPLATYLLMSLYSSDKKLATIGTISSALLVMGSPFLLISPGGITLTFYILFFYGFLLLFKHNSIRGLVLAQTSIYCIMFSYSFGAIFYSLILCLAALSRIRTVPRKITVSSVITLVVVSLANFFGLFRGMFDLRRIFETGILLGPFAYSLGLGNIPYLYSPKEPVSPQLVVAGIVAVSSLAYIIKFRRRSAEADLFLDMCIVSGLICVLSPRLVTMFFFYLQPVFCGSMIQIAERSKRRLSMVLLILFMVLVLSTPLLTPRTAYAKYGTFNSDYIDGIRWVEKETEGHFVSDLKFATAFYALTGSERGVHCLDNLDERGTLTMLWYSSSVEGTVEYMRLTESRYVIITSDMSTMFIVCDYYRLPIHEKISQIQSSEQFVLRYKNDAVEVYELNSTLEVQG